MILVTLVDSGEEGRQKQTETGQKRSLKAQAGESAGILARPVGGARVMHELIPSLHGTALVHIRSTLDASGTRTTNHTVSHPRADT